MMYKQLLFIGSMLAAMNSGLSSEGIKYSNEDIDRRLGNCMSVEEVLDLVEKVKEKAGIDKAVYAANNLCDYVDYGEDLEEYIERLKDIDSTRFNQIIKEMHQKAFNSPEANYFVK